MIERLQHQHTTWYDVLNPSAEEVRELATEAGLPLELVGDLTSETPRTDAHAVKGAVKITLDFPIVKRTDIKHPHEVKFIATKNSLVTVRFEDIQAIDHFKKDFEVVSLLKKSSQKTTGCDLMTTLLLRMYKGLDSKLDYLAGKLEVIDGDIFAEKEKEMVFEISGVGQRLIAFRHALGAHEAALGELYTGIGSAFGKTYQADILKITEQYLHLLRRVDRQKQTLNELRETNNALLTTKQNEIMKIFTILAFITFPLTLFTSMFGMNTATTPIVGQEGDFWLILSIMAVVSIIFFAFFKYKRWM